MHPKSIAASGRRSIIFLAIAIPTVGCGSAPSSHRTDAGTGVDSASSDRAVDLDARTRDAAAVPDAGDGSARCQALAEEDLYPHFDFSTDDGTFSDAPPASTCTRPSPDGGPPPRPDGGAGPAMPPPDGGPGPGPNGGSVGRVAVGLPNSYGKHADQIMPDVATNGDVASLDDFGMDHPLGTNGRHCETCHGNQQGWTSTPASFQDRFDNGVYYLTALCPKRVATNEEATRNDELEPIFRTRDGTNSPLADVSTPAARRSAYAMLLTKALIRIGLPVPTWEADFELIAVDDPYGFASASELSLFRRSPLMANLRFSTTVMWDGRETLPCQPLTASLKEQAKNAITGHAQGAPPSDSAVAAIVGGELGIYTTQFLHNEAGPLNQDGAHGGPTFLAQVQFYPGINSFDQIDPHGRPYSKQVFTLYQAWSALSGDSARDAARRRIAEGETIFNTREFTVSGVSGFNDDLGRPQIAATCGACHNTPEVGTNSEGRLMDIGVSDDTQRTPDLPLYTFREKSTGAIKRSSDPGQALITKKWAHMNRFKIPSLRSLAVRSPYLHNGSAPTLDAVVDYHDQRFGIQLTPEEKAALVAFLSAL